MGPPGSYSHLAARKKFGLSVEFAFVSTILAVFEEVEHGHAEFGLVPVENTIAGSIGETMDALVERDATVCGEMHLAVHHHLLGSVPIGEILHVYSKPEVIAQCQRWLSATGLADRTVQAASSSAAAQRASEEPGAAAIASELAAELYNLGWIEEFVEDEASNVTRFIVIGSVPPKATGNDKTTIVFCVGHRPGQLVDVLDVLRSAGINMTRIESRPNKREKWQYHFFVDIEGHADSPEIREPLSAAADHCRHWKVCGSYPRSDETL